jgi:hypothetical protein
MRCGVAVGLRAVFMVPSTSDAREHSNCANQQARLALDLGEVAADGVTLSVVVDLVLVPGLCGPGRVPASRGRAVALRAEPPGYRCLAPDGLPSLTQHGQAGGAG